MFSVTDCQSESGEAVKVSDKVTLQPRLCPNFLLTWFDTDPLLPYHHEQQKAAHSEAFFNSWITGKGGTISDSGACIRFVCNLKRKKAKQKTWLFFFFFLWKGGENQAKVERAKHDWKVFQQAEAAQVEKWIWHLLLLTLCTFWQSRLFILVTKKSVISYIRAEEEF